MDRYYYADPIKTFLEKSENEILGALSRPTEFSIENTQTDAWIEEIELLKQIVKPWLNGHIMFEYSIPRLGKRVDVILLINGAVLVLEFKVGCDKFNIQDKEQVWDYALDLKNFHQESHSLTIIPILVATEAPVISQIIGSCLYDDNVFEPLFANKSTLQDIITKSLSFANKAYIDPIKWINSRYAPTPTIIEAASALYNKHSVKDITRSEASAENLTKTSQAVIDIIKRTKEQHEKSICFITGVPGAGKTLIGLNVAIEQFEKDDLAVYLSGNQPLVSVLSEALARDKKKKIEQETNKKYNITQARREVKSFIQIVHHYRNNTLNKIKIENGKIEIDPTRTNKDKKDEYAEVEHVAIFDEAQRAWTKEQLSSWLSRKKRIPNFPDSEPEFLIWSLNLRQDWAVIVCLVGGGQEINTGEAGITEWISALNNHFKDWKIYISNHLTDHEYAEGNVGSLLANNSNVKIENSLHLSVSMRSFRAENVSLFVHYLLDLEIDKAKDIYNQIKDKYPIAITRRLVTGKGWLKKKARGSERYGLIVSSKAYRLKPLAIDVRYNPDTVHWFLDDSSDVRSSLFLEDAATEFDIQGLELDWSCIVWDGDFRYSQKGWDHYSFKGDKWNKIKKEEIQLYQKNAYRVLLTRARQGMVIVIPEGNPEDQTRKPSIYNPTYQYLKSIGINEI